MPEVTLTVGGRRFDLVCDPGQEPHLMRAAEMLDAEAAKLVAGKLPESRLLLMAGLMLADKLTEADQSLALRDQRIAKLEAELKAAGSPAQAGADAGDLAQAQAEAKSARDLLERVAEVLEEFAEQAAPQAG